MGLCQSSSIDFPQIFNQIDAKGTSKVYPNDLVKFLSVHRIAVTDRESEYLIYLSGSQSPYMDYNKYSTCDSVSNPTSAMETPSTSAR